jgi:potassium channel subfamily K
MLLYYTAASKVEVLLTPSLSEGPLANVLSIAALVTPWRMCLLDGVEPANCPWNGSSELLPDLEGHTLADPHWCYALNILSLALGFLGNLFLLLNFTNRIRYIVALPLTIFLWYAATAIVSPHKHRFWDIILISIVNCN